MVSAAFPSRRGGLLWGAAQQQHVPSPRRVRTAQLPHWDQNDFASAGTPPLAARAGLT